MSNAVLLSVVRTPSEVYALTGTRVEDRFEVARVPMERVRESAYPARNRLRQVWARLAEVGEANADVFCDVLVVLMETVPELPAVRPAVALDASWGRGEEPVKRTAAHPRGYRGTKAKPAKVRRDRVDIRPYLCGPGPLRTMGAALAKFAAAGRKRLAREGWAAADIDRALAELLGEEQDKPVWQMPPAFALLLWARVRNGQGAAGRWLRLYLAVGLDIDRKALEAVSRLAAVAGTDAAFEWADISCALGMERRSIFLHLVADSFGSDSGAHRLAAGGAIREQIGEVSFLAADERFAQWMGALFQVLLRGDTAEYLLAGMRLAGEFAPRYLFSDIGSCDDLPVASLDAIARGLEDNFSAWKAIELWEACGRLPGLARLVAASQWQTMGQKAAAAYVRLLADLGALDPSRRSTARKWAAIAKALPEIERLALASPEENRDKVIGLADEWFYSAADSALTEKRMPHGFALLRRLAGSPVEAGAGARRIVWHFLSLSHEKDLERFTNAPDASFEALERECRRDNDAALGSCGIQAMAGGLSRLAADAFVGAPGKLFRVARKLGSLPEPERAVVVKKCAKNSLVRIDAMRAKLEQVCQVIAVRSASHMTNPIPAQLSKWMRQQITLTPARVERYRRVLAERLILTKLDVVEHAVVERLKRGLPKPEIDAREEFALLLLGSARDNRRGLRKFLNAYWRGDRDYLKRHPATAAWYRKHPSVPREIWERGVEFAKGGYTIRLERGPLEVLRLGEYVGSCLGLGGCNSHSAIAALLDANKQVLYARDKSGRVAGRQLVAISDEDRLVCFSVYPKGSSARMKALFRAYDLAFSEALGVPIYIAREVGDGYRIEQVLSQDWYDDYAWDLTVKEESEGAGPKRGAKMTRRG